MDSFCRLLKVSQRFGAALLLAGCLQLSAVADSPPDDSWQRTPMAVKKMVRQGSELVDQRRYVEGIERMEQAMEIAREQNFSQELLAFCKYELAVAYEKASRREPAVVAYREYLRLKESENALDPIGVVGVLNHIVDLQKELGRYQDALPEAERAYALLVEVRGQEHLETAVQMHRLASLYFELGAYDRALRLYEQSAALKRKLLPAGDSSLLVTLGNLGDVYREFGRVREARELYTQVKVAHERRFGANHPQVAQGLNRLALLAGHVKDHKTALSLFEQAVKILREHPETDLTYLSVVLSNLADLLASRGDFARAETLYEEALELERQADTPQLRGIARISSNLAMMLTAIGDLERAEPLLRQALEVQQETLGEQSLELAVSLIRLGDVLLGYQRNRHDEAEALYQRALSIQEKSLGSDHPDLAYVHSRLGMIRRDSGDLASARRHFETSLQQRLKQLGSDQLPTAWSQFYLSTLYALQGDEERARELAEHADVTITGRLGDTHVDAMKSARHRALLGIAQTQPESALPMAQREAKALLALTGNVFTFASERQRLAFREQLRPYDLFATLGASEELASALLRYKGLVLDSVSEDLALAQLAQAGPTRALVERLQQAKAEWHAELEPSLRSSDQASSEPSSPVSVARQAELRQQIEQLESDLARLGTAHRPARRALSVSVGEVRDRLPARTALVEFVEYRHYRGVNDFEPRYGALLLTAQESRFVSLGPSSVVQEQVRQYRRFLRGQATGRWGASSAASLQTLYATVWKPLEAELDGDIEQLILSPDGELNFVSFATLVDSDGRFLAERYLLAYVSSGRDLLSSQARASSGEHVFVGDPLLPTSDPPFDPLPHTKIECETLASQLAQQGALTRLYLGEDASESRVKRLQSPQLLHLATHGYLPSSTADPMTGSGLLLNPTPGLEDGYLSAAEVSLIDLRGTQLVTLSACDTGGGGAVAGEGVLGLRRGFVKAGAQNLLLTLWPVQDRQTAEFMESFYREKQSAPAALALARVQRRWLEELARTHSVGEAAAIAGPFILSFQGAGWAQPAPGP